MTLLRRLWYLLRARRVERDLEDEIGLHRALIEEELIERGVRRLLGRWLGVIAGIALLLATIGIWGVTAHGVAERTREIGVRMALGARTTQVTWLFLRRTATWLAIGLTLGVLAALAVARLLQAFLVETGARDPLTLVGVIGILAAAAFTAALVPARRAARLNPVVALRRD